MSACDTPHWLDLPALEVFSAHRHAILGDLFCARFGTGGHQPLSCATYWRVWGTPSYAMIRYPAFARKQRPFRLSQWCFIPQQRTFAVRLRYPA